MYRIPKSVLLSLVTVLAATAVSLWAADLSPATTPVWKEKPLRRWSEEDAKQVLAADQCGRVGIPGEKARDGWLVFGVQAMDAAVVLKQVRNNGYMPGRDWLGQSRVVCRCFPR
jgi:hypothetical protein